MIQNISQKKYNALFALLINLTLQNAVKTGKMSKFKVLVFDDELSEIGKMYIGLLQKDFSVEVTMDPKEIPMRFKRMEPGIVIVSNENPDFNAHEICQLVKKEANVPIILLVEKHSSTTVEIDSCNADDILYKPVDLNELVAKIKKWHALSQ